MQDRNGNIIRVDDYIFTYRHGVCKITKADHEDVVRTELAFIAGQNGRGDSFHYTQDIFLKEMPEAYRIRTWKEMAEEAVQIQNASNLLGVLNSFVQIVKEVRARLQIDDPSVNISEKVEKVRDANYHPICMLYADKISSLCGTQNATTLEMMKAYDWAQEHKDPEAWKRLRAEQ